MVELYGMWVELKEDGFITENWADWCKRVLGDEEEWKKLLGIGIGEENERDGRI